jgi:glycerol kinase
MLGVPVVRPEVSETTALGGAYLAGIAVGFWESREEIGSLWSIERIFQPTLSKERREALYAGWKGAIAATQAFK